MKFTVLLPLAVLAASVAAAPEARITPAGLAARDDSTAESVGGDIKSAADKAGDWIGTAAENAGTGIKDAAEAAKTIAANAGDKVKDVAETAGDKVKDVANDVKNSIAGDSAASPRAVLPTAFAGAAGLAVGVAALLF